MKFRAAFLTLTLALSATALTGEAQAGEPKNLKVLKFNGKPFKKGMKSFTKGLGVKCKACHIKGKFDSDDMKTKIAGREFLKLTVGEKDQGKRDAALKTLLSALKLDAAKKTGKVWAGIDLFEKK